MAALIRVERRDGDGAVTLGTALAPPGAQPRLKLHGCNPKSGSAHPSPGMQKTEGSGLSHPTGHCPLGHPDPPTPSHHLPPPRPTHLGNVSPAPCYGTVEALRWGTSVLPEAVTEGRGGEKVVKGHRHVPPAPRPCPRGGISSPRCRHPRQHLLSEGCWVFGGGLLGSRGGTRSRGGSGVTSTQGAGVVKHTGLPRCHSSLHAAPHLCGKRERGFPKGSLANQPMEAPSATAGIWAQGCPGHLRVWDGEDSFPGVGVHPRGCESGLASAPLRGRAPNKGFINWEQHTPKSCTPACWAGTDPLPPPRMGRMRWTLTMESNWDQAPKGAELPAPSRHGPSPVAGAAEGLWQVGVPRCTPTQLSPPHLAPRGSHSPSRCSQWCCVRRCWPYMSRRTSARCTLLPKPGERGEVQASIRPQISWGGGLTLCSTEEDFSPRSRRDEGTYCSTKTIN